LIGTHVHDDDDGRRDGEKEEERLVHTDGLAVLGDVCVFVDAYIAYVHLSLSIGKDHMEENLGRDATRMRIASAATRALSKSRKGSSSCETRHKDNADEAEPSL
jgi:hypothetical protein